MIEFTSYRRYARLIRLMTSKKKKFKAEYIPPGRSNGTDFEGSSEQREDGEEKVEFKRGRRPAGGLLARLGLFWRMFRDKGYRISGGLRILLILVPLWIISPLDLLPDLVPGLGLVDDLFMLSLLLGMLGGETRRYRRFRGEEE